MSHSWSRLSIILTRHPDRGPPHDVLGYLTLCCNQLVGSTLASIADACCASQTRIGRAVCGAVASGVERWASSIVLSYYKCLNSKFARVLSWCDFHCLLKQRHRICGQMRGSLTDMPGRVRAAHCKFRSHLRACTVIRSAQYPGSRAMPFGVNHPTPIRTSSRVGTG